MMRVVKRNGECEEVSFDKVLNRIKNLSNNLSVNVFDIAQKVCSRIYDNVKTSVLDELAAHICSSMMTEHPDYGTLAARIIISNHHKNTSPSLSEVVTMLYNNVDVHGEPNPLIGDELYEIVMKNKEKLNSYIVYNRDYLFDYFGFKTLERSYLLKVNGNVVERPQQMLMRVALGIHRYDIKEALNTYDLMSQKYFIHATPTLFNAGTPRPQLSSCFLLHLNEDSITGIFSSLQECAMISKYAGGIGIHIHNVRGKGSRIRGTNGISSGIVPMLRVFNNTARYVDQAGKRAGSIAIYLEPWHIDIEAFLELKKNHGNEEERARDLFYALWIPDLFMERVKENGQWSFMCPDECPGLSDCYGDDFKQLYEKYENEGRAKKQIKAQELWWQILQSQIEQGVPYLLYKDAVNRKSNQQNLGTIKSSNLCVAGDTMILTEKGYHPIKTLVNSSVRVWNGTQFSDTVVRQTGNMQKLVTVQFSNGMELKCTPYHKFYIETSSRPANKSIPVVVEAKDLTADMRIIRYEVPCLDTSTQEMKYPYTHGLLCAEGTYCKYDEDKKHQCAYKKWENTDFCKRHQHYEKLYNDEEKCCAQSFCDKPLLYLYDQKKDLIDHVDYIYYNTDTKVDRLNVSLPYDIEKKYFVPINYSVETKVKWLSGYFDGDGCVVKCDGIKNIQVASINKEFLTQVVFLLQTLGVNAYISVLREQCQRLLPDGRGNQKEYPIQKCYRMNIDSKGVINLVKLGLQTKRLDLSNLRSPHHTTNKFVRIVSVEDVGEVDDTYCFNEPIEHKGIFNGVITGNCSEIVEFTSPDEVAVCNLASIALASYVEFDEQQKPSFNFNKLHEVTKVVTKNLNKVIDVNFYPLEKARRSNLKHRPIGIGVQGLADAYVLMRYPFDSSDAMKLNRDIFETIYHGACEASMEIAKKRQDILEAFKDNTLTEQEIDDLYDKLNLNEYETIHTKYPGAYSSFDGSPASKGELQFDLWGVSPTKEWLWDWTNLKTNIMKYGMRNSLLLAPMPTASTSQILGFNECFEPFTSNLYKRKTMAGEFIIVNKYLIQDLVNLGLWDKEMKNKIIISDGSIQSIDTIPNELKSLYKTAWEIKQKVLIDQSADRGKFVCQSQSLNLFVEDPDFKKLSSMHFYSWQQGLKTGIYYLRTKSKAQAQKFTIDPSMVKLTNLKPNINIGGSNMPSVSSSNINKPREVVCHGDVCEFCSS
jgi:ribonucleoside-diphosphate reductase alpha chain